MTSSASLAHSSRRQFLGGLGATAAGAWLGSRELRAQGTREPRAIDCHHHFTSPAWIKVLTARDGKKLSGYTTWFALPKLKPYTPAKDLEDMDREGVATSMMSCTTPGIWFGDPDETTMLAREMNEFGAKVVSDHKTRFGLFALVPLPLIDPSLKAIEYAFDTLKADGVGLVSSYGDRWLGDPWFRPVMDELNRRRAVVYVHPTDAPCCQELFPGGQPGTVEYNTDTARTIYSLLYNNSATRYGNIRFIFSHGGGTMPSLVERFGVGQPDNINQNLRGTPEPNSRLYHLRRFYYDTAQSTNIVQMTGLKTVAGAQQIVYGTDYPFGSFAKHIAGLKECGFTPNELEGVFRRNALRLFPRLNA